MSHHKIYGPLSCAEKSIMNWLIPQIYEDSDDIISQIDSMCPHIYLQEWKHLNNTQPQRWEWHGPKMIKCARPTE